MRHLVRTAAMTVAVVTAIFLGATGSAQAASWTDVDFPAGEIAQAVVEDAAGNIWATTVLEDGSFGHVHVLEKGSEVWIDACQGLDWSSSSWSTGLVSVGGEVFLTTEDGTCYARSVGDASWRRIDSTIQFLRLTEWDGYLWSGTRYLGVGRLDPDTEQTDYVRDGLLVVMDNPAAARAYRSPGGNDDYLYVGSTVSPEVAEREDFEGATVYRLARGSATWENTGLDVLPEAGDLNLRGSGDYTDWGVWNLVVMEGYVVCQVMIPVSGYPVRCFIYDERAAAWSLLEMPESETGWYYLTSGEPAFVRNGRFYFPKTFVADGVICDVLDPDALAWRENVRVEGRSWPPLANTAQVVGDELLVAYSEEEAGGDVVEDDAADGISFVESVPLPTELSTDPGVVGTNFGLTLLIALVFGFTATLFNYTLEGNHERIARVFSPLSRGAKGLGAASAPLIRRAGNRLVAVCLRSETVRRVAPRLSFVGTGWIRPSAIVLLAALIYAFLDPTFGFSGHGVGIFLSLALSVAVVTFAYDGVQALIGTRGYRIPATLKLFPAAIAIAVLCVLISRLTHFSPGYIYGFVAGTVFLGGREPDARDQGRLVLFSAVCLLAVSIAAWFITIPLAESSAGGSRWASGLESICTAIFVTGLEGLVFGLLPLSVMDGGDLFRWSKAAWAVLFAVVLFLFWHVLLNQNSAYASAFEQSNTKVVLVFLGCWTVVTVAFYLLFRKPKPKTPTGGSPGQPPPALWGTGQWSPEQWGEQAPQQPRPQPPFTTRPPAPPQW